MSRKNKILIVEDEKAIREMLVYALVTAGYDFIEAEDVDQAHSQIQADRPDLILLDWMLPEFSGVDYVRRLRAVADTRSIPIIMLTARGVEDDRVRGFEAGVDDYISKPFSTKELLARIKAVLRRCNVQHDIAPITVQALTLDPGTHRVTINTEDVNVSPKGIQVIAFFVTHPERVYDRAQLLDRVWGSNIYVEERTIDVHIRRLRKVLAPYGYDCYIQTVHGVGYRFSTR